MLAAVGACALGVAGTVEAKTGAAASGKKAHGSPYLVGEIDDVFPGSDAFLEYEAGVKAAISYVNNKLDGINGHPLRLTRCSTGSIEQTQPTATCATQIAAKHPIMVVGTAAVYGIAGAPIMEAHHIPSALIPELPQDTQDADSFPAGDAAASQYPGEGAFAWQHFHPNTVSILQASGPTNAGATAAIEKPLMGKGVKMSAYTYPFTGSSLSAVVQAVQSKPDVLILNGASGSLAETLFKEVQEQGYPSNHIITLMATMDGPTLKQVGATMNGTIATFDVVPWTDTKNAQVATFLKAYKQYGTAGVTDQSGNAEWGFGDIMEIYNTATKVQGKVTGPKLLAYMKSAKSIPGFLNHAQGPQTPGEPGVRDQYIFPSAVEHGTIKPVTGSWFAAPTILPKS